MIAQQQWILLLVFAVVAVFAQDDSSSTGATLQADDCACCPLNLEPAVQMFSDDVAKMYSPVVVDGYGPYTDFEFGTTMTFTRSGFVTALRFFYDVNSLTSPTAPWILSLWTGNSSTRVTTSLPVSDVVVGWNTVPLPTRALVQANTMYGVSVGFTGTGSFFKTVDKAFSPAMQSSTTTIIPIGTYMVPGGLGTNPFNSNARNYMLWVDVVFEASVAPVVHQLDPVGVPFILALGSAVGTGAVVTLMGNDSLMNVTVKAGTGASGSGTGAVQISFGRSYTSVPTITVIPTNAAAQAKTFTINGANSESSWTLWQSGTALTAGVTYMWDIKVVPFNPYNAAVYGLIAREPVDKWNTTSGTLAAQNYVPQNTERAQEMADRLGPSLARVAFIGDSITGNFMGDGLAVWNREFAEAPYHAINLGVSGDKTNNVLWRLNANLANVGPQCNRFVILTGRNNFPVNGATGQDTSQAIRMMTARIQARKDPDAPWPHILIVGALPGSPNNAQQKALNNRLRSDHEDLSRNVRVLRLDSQFWARGSTTSVNGTLFNDKSYGNKGLAATDGVHINAEGYEVYGNNIKLWLKQTESY